MVSTIVFEKRPNATSILHFELSPPSTYHRSNIWGPAHLFRIWGREWSDNIVHEMHPNAAPIICSESPSHPHKWGGGGGYVSLYKRLSQIRKYTESSTPVMNYGEIMVSTIVFEKHSMPRRSYVLSPHPLPYISPIKNMVVSSPISNFQTRMAWKYSSWNAPNISRNPFFSAGELD